MMFWPRLPDFERAAFLSPVEMRQKFVRLGSSRVAVTYPQALDLWFDNPGETPENMRVAVAAPTHSSIPGSDRVKIEGVPPVDEMGETPPDIVTPRRVGFQSLALGLRRNDQRRPTTSRAVAGTLGASAAASGN